MNKLKTALIFIVAVLAYISGGFITWLAIVSYDLGYAIWIILGYLTVAGYFLYSFTSKKQKTYNQWFKEEILPEFKLEEKGNIENILGLDGISGSQVKGVMHDPNDGLDLDYLKKFNDISHYVLQAYDLYDHGCEYDSTCLTRYNLDDEGKNTLTLAHIYVEHVEERERYNRRKKEYEKYYVTVVDHNSYVGCIEFNDRKFPTEVAVSTPNVYAYSDMEVFESAYLGVREKLYITARDQLGAATMLTPKILDAFIETEKHILDKYLLHFVDNKAWFSLPERFKLGVEEQHHWGDITTPGMFFSPINHKKSFKRRLDRTIKKRDKIYQNREAAWVEARNKLDATIEHLKLKEVKTKRIKQKEVKS